MITGLAEASVYTPEDTSVNPAAVNFPFESEAVPLEFVSVIVTRNCSSPV